MATRKQKRAEALARRQAFMEEIQRTGLEALQKERQRRAHEDRQKWQDQHDKKHFKFVNECPLCRDILRAQKQTDEVSATA